MLIIVQKGLIDFAFNAFIVFVSHRKRVLKMCLIRLSAGEPVKLELPVVDVEDVGNILNSVQGTNRRWGRHKATEFV